MFSIFLAKYGNTYFCNIFPPITCCCFWPYRLPSHSSMVVSGCGHTDFALGIPCRARWQPRQWRMRWSSPAGSRGKWWPGRFEGMEWKVFMEGVLWIFLCDIFMYLYDFVCVYIWTYIIFIVIVSKFFVYEHTSLGIVLGHVVAPKSELGLYMFVFLQFRS